MLYDPSLEVMIMEHKQYHMFRATAALGAYIDAEENTM
jgi:hypothetical protein